MKTGSRRFFYETVVAAMKVTSENQTNPFTNTLPQGQILSNIAQVRFRAYAHLCKHVYYIPNRLIANKHSRDLSLCSLL